MLVVKFYGTWCPYIVTRALVGLVVDKGKVDEVMNMDGVAFYSCLSLAGLFFPLALLLMLLGEKGAVLISGFNTWPKSKRDMYDKRKLVSDQARLLWIWAIILSMGAVLSYFISPYFGLVAFILWLILAFKDVHWDANRAFEKYRKSPHSEHKK